MCEPTIYNIGLTEKKVIELLSLSKDIQINILPKYSSQLVEFGGNINYFENLKFISSTFWVKNDGGSFTPSYSSSDPAGNNAWPCIGEGNFPIQTNEINIDFTILDVNSSPVIIYYGSYKIVNGKIYLLFKASTGPINHGWLNSPQFMANLNE